MNLRDNRMRVFSQWNHLVEVHASVVVRRITAAYARRRRLSLTIFPDGHIQWVDEQGRQLCHRHRPCVVCGRLTRWRGRAPAADKPHLIETHAYCSPACHRTRDGDRHPIAI